MSFWTKQPITLDGSDIKQNLTDEEALMKVNAELEASRLKLEYVAYDGSQMSTALIKELLEFINNNYMRSDDIRVLYSESFLAHYVKNSIVLYFHSKGKLVGTIIGKHRNVYIYDKIYKISEANFLCLTPKLRSMGLIPYIIGVLIREGVVQLNISKAYYTISTPIKSASFCNKYSFFRPVKKYKDIISLKYTSGIADNIFAAELEKKLLTYSQKTYSIFDHKTTDEIASILATPAFHNFAFYKDNILTDFISINTVINAEDNGEWFRVGFIYIVILSNMSTKHIQCILDSVSSYCLENNIIEVLSVSDIFPGMRELGFESGDKPNSYYIYNMNMHPIENTKNGIMIL